MAQQILPYTSMVHDPDKERDKHDFYVTPENAITPLLDLDCFHDNIWDNAVGDGAISNVFKDNGYNVFNSDIVDRGCNNLTIDFLQTDSNFYPCGWKEFDIVTNPPFKYAQEFVYHAMMNKRCTQLFMFGRLGFLESKKRKEMFVNTPLKTVYVFSWRVSMWRRGDVQKGGKNMPFAWYAWDKHYTGKPCLEWI